MATLSQRGLVAIQLRQLALTDWTKFEELVKLDYTKYIICMKKDAGKSVRQIAISTRRSRSAIGRICKVCP